MTLPIEPGCMAVIVGAYYDHADIGKQVDVIEFMQPGNISSVVCPDGLPAILSKKSQGPGWLVFGAGPNGFCFKEERHLLRIDGHKEPAKKLAHEVTA